MSEFERVPGVQTVTVDRHPDPGANEAAGTVLTTDLDTFLSNHQVCVAFIWGNGLVPCVTIVMGADGFSVGSFGCVAHRRSWRGVCSRLHVCAVSLARITQVLTEEIFGPATLVVQCKFVRYSVDGSLDRLLDGTTS